MGANSPETSIPLFILKPKATVDITLAAPQGFKQGTEDNHPRGGLDK